MVVVKSKSFSLSQQKSLPYNSDKFLTEFKVGELTFMNKIC